MNLLNLGFNKELENLTQGHDFNDLVIGRVLAEHKERYIVQTEHLELEAEITGHLRFTARERSDFPAVGDWVALSIFDNDLAIIHKILARKGVLERNAVGKFGEKQIIGTNIDCAFIVMAVDRDFNINRLERFLNVSYSGDVEPIVLLSKIDLVSEKQLATRVNEIRKRHKEIKIIPFSNLQEKGRTMILAQIKRGKTYCVLGSSGVGKSTLVNHLMGKEIIKTGSISGSTKKGKHITSHRELFVLKDGGVLIDTPGMRAVGIIENVEEVFDDIASLATQCKFNDCTHMHEEGCAVLTALEEGLVDHSSYENFLKLQRESERSQASIAEKRKKDKAFGKMVKTVMKDKRKNG